MNTELKASMIFDHMFDFVISHKYNYKRFINSTGDSAWMLASLKFTMYEINKFVSYVDKKAGVSTPGYIENVIDSELNYILNNGQ